MMTKNMAIVCFTPQGKELAKRLQRELPSPFLDAHWKIDFIYKPVPFKQWMKEHFSDLDAIVFIGAMGIVVRDMAPCLKSKLTDPAVVVMDEKGQFVISVLSGHIGGGNALTHELAHFMGAIPVITTSSDVNRKIAIDMFAKNNDLAITSMKQAKLCASEIVSGYPVSFSCEGEIRGNVPEEMSGNPAENVFHVAVSPHGMESYGKLLQLIPKAFVLGIGCKKNTPEKVIEARVKEELESKNIDIRSIKGIASIDLKKEEEGLLAFAKKKKIPMHFYSAKELSSLPGAFTPSAFVSSITGVENVCERAAYKLVLEGEDKKLEECMILPKSGREGVTIAIMKIDWSVSFE